MTITAEFDQPVERAWQLWADPRQLERWWGPPTYPATVVDHDLTPGGTVRYFMTGPDGDRSRGWWRVLTAEAPRRLEFEDGFAGDDGEPNPNMPTMVIRVALDEREGGGTRMHVVTTFPSIEVMDQMIAMGMEEGMAAGLSQIDAILAEDVTASS
jgi:uncharacterized protein YndB with AHSA1/START domain